MNALLSAAEQNNLPVIKLLVEDYCADVNAFNYVRAKASVYYIVYTSYYLTFYREDIAHYTTLSETVTLT